MQATKKMFFALAIIASTLSLTPTTIQATTNIDKRLEILEKRVSLLEKNELTYGPITVSRIRFDHAKSYAIVAPGAKINCSFHYELDSSQQEFLSKNYLIVGLKDVAAETCVATLYGIWDSTGTVKFDLTTPLEVGEYEVKIAYRPGENCEEALNSWNVLGNEPSSAATIGFLRVANP